VSYASASYATDRDLHLPRRHPAQTQVVKEARRFNVLVCGRRWGKTTLGLDVLIDEPGGMLDGKPTAWFAPNSKQFDEAWQEAVRLLKPIAKRVDSQKNRIHLLTGGTLDFWHLHNTDDPGRGYAYSLVVIDEAALVPSERLRRQWLEAIRPTLTDMRGGAWFCSTPKGSGYFRELYDNATTPEWARWRLPTVSNPFIDPLEVEAAREGLPSAVFRQEYLAEFVTDFGAVYRPPTYYQPDELPRDGYREATGCDFAYTSKAGDWTVFITGREANGIVYVTDLYRAQAESTEWAKRLQSVPAPFAFIGGQERGIADFLRRDYNIRLKTERAATDKLSRAMPSVTAWNRGEIRLPARAPITLDIEAEVLAFTGNDKVDATDDIVDALAALHHALIGNRKTDLTEARRKAGLA
jgi:phage terminase large subunit-like protein